jgi:UDP-N-acetylglucosamine--N-acetylmuramyl-(pentapeptide) pyrophosphoryl-undecaprenol N-acetylglucosamine transferase
MIAEIEKLYGDQSKVKAMSESAAKLHLSDTNDRILAVIDSLIAKASK